MTVSLLFTLLIWALIAYVIFIVIDMLPLPGQVLLIAKIIVGLVILLKLLALVGIAGVGL